MHTTIATDDLNHPAILASVPHDEGDNTQQNEHYCATVRLATVVEFGATNELLRQGSRMSECLGRYT